MHGRDALEDHAEEHAMSDLLGKIDDPRALEVVEALLNLCMEREKEISELADEVERLRRERAESIGEEIIVVEPERAPSRRRDIMIADGSDLTRSELGALLERYGYEVVASARDGREAVELYKEKRPALVTVDTHLPVLDGYKVTREILRHDPGARVIVVSRVRDKTMVLEAIMAGASDYVIKPVQPQRLLSSIKRLLAS
jgi:two-component system chemotaxis response regulator CheY